MNKRVLVDSCILSDLLHEQNKFREWSENELHRCGLAGFKLFINPIIFGEFSINFETIEESKSLLEKWNMESIKINDSIMFAAARAQRLYKKNGGKRDSILADFAIGACAEYYDMLLLTRDKGNFKTYFPNVPRIEP